MMTRRGLGLALLAIVAGVAGGRAGEDEPAAAFPLRVSQDRRSLVDAQGRPFLVVGDTPWSLIADLSEADARAYLDDRARRGFNALIVNLIEHKFSTDPPRNRAGDAPFLRPGAIGAPNPAYFDHAHRIIAMARDRGIAVWLCPAYLGWGGGDEGFFREIEAAGPEVLRAYGASVGTRFKDLPNIVWMVGGDYAVPPEHRWAIVDLAGAIRGAGANQLMTVHGGQQSSVEVVGEQPWIDVNGTYSYEPELFRKFWADSAREPVRPFVLLEAVYENEHDATPDVIRRQAYWAMTGGAAGQFLGNSPIWHFDGPGLFPAPRGWRAELDGTGSRDMTRLRAAFVARPWHRLVPDVRGTLVPDGAGSGTATITAAATPDGRLAMLYVPSTGRDVRAFSVDLSRLASSSSASWFNPTTGTTRPAAPAAPPPDRGAARFETPGDNGTGANDWLLILEAGR